MKDLSKVIKKFEKLTYMGYVRKSPKHEPTESYFYLARQLAKCMMRDYVLNSYGDPIRTEITSTQQTPILHVCDSDIIKPKEILEDNSLLQVYYMDKDE